MKESSLIKNRDRAKQLLAFDGMQYGRCRPTDIDLSMDWQGKTFVFVEMKGRGAPLTLGQKLHLEGLVNAIRAGGKTAWAIVAEHDTAYHEHDVHCAESKVRVVYDGNSWAKENLGEKSLDSLLQDLHTSHQLEYPQRSKTA